MSEHTSVLLSEAVTALVWNRDGVYVDGTFGRGGHSERILQRLSEQGGLHGFDKDPQAVSSGEALQAKDRRFQIHAGSFTQMEQFANQQGLLGCFAGILLDLGVSSPQLDSAERGFSFQHDGPLDMRMNPEVGLSAAEWLEQVEFQDLADVLKTYGEERFAKRIAAALIEARQEAPITRTVQLAELIKTAHPRWEKDRHPATRSFQAIRIFINGELDELEQALHQAMKLLAIDGRLVVISFHSLEDRITKRFMRNASRPASINAPKNIPLRDEDSQAPALRLLGKAVRSSSEEQQRNRRARSAIMRVAQRAA